MNLLTTTRTILFYLASASLLVTLLQAREIEFGGFISTGYLKSSRYNYLANTEEGSGDFTEAGLNASWTPLRRTTVNGQLFAFELGPYGNYEATIDYLFVDYNFRREFGIQAGRVKREFGLYTHLQDIDLSRASILLPMGIYDHRYRYNSAALEGIATYGNISLWQNAYLDYSVHAGKTDIPKEGGLAGFVLTGFSNITESMKLQSADLKSSNGAQIWIKPGIEGLKFGIGSSQYVDLDIIAIGTFRDTPETPGLNGVGFRIESDDFDVSNTQLSAEYFKGNWSITSEFLRRKASYGIKSQVAGHDVGTSNLESLAKSWYLSAARRFGALEIAVTYTEDTNDNVGVPVGTKVGTNKDKQLSIRYDVSSHWTLKTEIHDIEGTGRLFNHLQQNPIIDRSDWRLFALKSTFFF